MWRVSIVPAAALRARDAQLGIGEEDAVRAIIERYLPQLRQVFEEACAWVCQQLQARRSAARDAPVGAAPAPGNPMLQPLAVSDRTLDRLAAGTDDRFVRDTVVAVRRRQFSHHAYYRAQAEEDHHAPAIAREHARLVAEHEQDTRRRWWQRRRPEPPKPAWEDAAQKVIERHLPQLRRIFEETCARVSQQLEEGRLVAGHQRNAAAETPRPAVPGPGRTEDCAPERNRATGGVTVRATGAREVPPSRVEKLLEGRARIEQLYEQAREMEFGSGRSAMEREAMAAENALDRKIRALPGSEQRELQSREQARGLDRGGPSR